MSPWEVVGRVSTRHKLIPTEIARSYDGCCAASALCGRAGPVTFLLRQKGNPKRRPQGFACFLRCSQRAGRIATTGAIRSFVSQLTQQPHADGAGDLHDSSGLRPRVAPLLGANPRAPPKRCLIATRCVYRSLDADARVELLRRG